MTQEYIVFGALVIVALILDFFVFSKRGQDISFRSATIQSIFWIVLSLAFGLYVREHHGPQRMIEYYVAYVMEKSLSVDNIVVFIMIFESFRVPKKNIYKALTIGILLAIVMRVLFIILGVELVNRFEIILVFFGLFLVYTSYIMMFADKDEPKDPRNGKVFKFIASRFRINLDDESSKFVTSKNGKPALSKLGLVILMIAFSDFVFALDSLPTVLAISRDQFVVMSSNVLAVLGLRALYYLMKNAIDKFFYLSQGVAFVLFFIGVKLILSFLGYHISETISLFVVLIVLGVSILVSLPKNSRKDA